jgi:hypothetical protein
MDASWNFRPDWKDGTNHRGRQRDRFCTALELSRAGARVDIAVRNETKGKDTIRRLRTEVPDANPELIWVCHRLAAAAPSG